MPLLWSGHWHWSGRALKIAFDLFGLYVLHRVCQGLIGARADLLAAGLPTRWVDGFVRIAEIAPFLAAVIVVIEVSRHLYRAYKSVA